MKKEIKKQWNKFAKWWNKPLRKIEEIEEDRKYNEFIKKVVKRMNKFSAVQKEITYEKRVQIALMFENVYIQKKMAEMKRTSVTVTVALLIVAIASIITTAYGTSGLENLISTFVGTVFLVAVCVGTVFCVVKIFAWIFKLLFKKLNTIL